MVARNQKIKWLKRDLPIVAAIVIVALVLMIVCLLVLPSINAIEVEKQCAKTNVSLSAQSAGLVDLKAKRNSSKTNQEHEVQEINILAKVKDATKNTYRESH